MHLVSLRADGQGGSAAGQGTQTTGSLCRRNGKVGLSGMAIADITLLSGFHALRADLEKVGRALRSPAPSLQPLQVTLLWPSPCDPLLLCS